MCCSHCCSQLLRPLAAGGQQGAAAAPAGVARTCTSGGFAVSWIFSLMFPHPCPALPRPPPPLQLQSFVELLRSGGEGVVEQALAFAQETLAPLVQVTVGADPSVCVCGCVCVCECVCVCLCVCVCVCVCVCINAAPLRKTPSSRPTWSAACATPTPTPPPTLSLTMRHTCTRATALPFAPTRAPAGACSPTIIPCPLPMRSSCTSARGWRCHVM